MYLSITTAVYVGFASKHTKTIHGAVIQLELNTRDKLQEAGRGTRVVTHRYLLAHCATHCSVPLLDEMASKLDKAAKMLGSGEPLETVLRMAKKRSARACVARQQ